MERAQREDLIPPGSFGQEYPDRALSGTAEQPVDLLSESDQPDGAITISSDDESLEPGTRGSMAHSQLPARPTPHPLPAQPVMDANVTIQSIVPWQSFEKFRFTTNGRKKLEQYKILAAQAALNAGQSAEAAKRAVQREYDTQRELDRLERRHKRAAQREARFKDALARPHRQSQVESAAPDDETAQNGGGNVTPAGPSKEQAATTLTPPDAFAPGVRPHTRARSRKKRLLNPEISGLHGDKYLDRRDGIHHPEPWYGFGTADEIPDFDTCTVVTITSKLQSLLETSAFAFTLKHDQVFAARLVSAHDLELHVWVTKISTKEFGKKSATIVHALCRDPEKLVHGLENAIFEPDKWDRILRCVAQIRHTATHRSRGDTEFLLECVGAAGHLLDVMQDREGFAIANKLQIMIYCAQNRLEEDIAALRRQAATAKPEDTKANVGIKDMLLDNREMICQRLIKQVDRLFARPSEVIPSDDMF